MVARYLKKVRLRKYQGSNAGPWLSITIASTLQIPNSRDIHHMLIHEATIGSCRLIHTSTKTIHMVVPLIATKISARYLYHLTTVTLILMKRRFLSWCKRNGGYFTFKFMQHPKIPSVSTPSFKGPICWCGGHKAFTVWSVARTCVSGFHYVSITVIAVVYATKIEGFSEESFMPSRYALVSAGTSLLPCVAG